MVNSFEYLDFNWENFTTLIANVGVNYHSYTYTDFINMDYDRCLILLNKLGQQKNG